MSETALSIEIRTLAGVIEAARSRAASGEVIDAAALDREVASLCDRAARLTGDDAAEARRALEELLATVETLAATLDQRLAAMREEMSGTQLRRQAVSAYGSRGVDKKR